MIAWCEEHCNDVVEISSFKCNMPERPSSTACPLCNRYVKQSGSCCSCPVNAVINTSRCLCTPYYKILTAETIEQFIAALKEERNFLATLDYKET
jgi:hypothetical protein